MLDKMMSKSIIIIAQNERNVVILYLDLFNDGYTTVSRTHTSIIVLCF